MRQHRLHRPRKQPPFSLPHQLMLLFTNFTNYQLKLLNENTPIAVYTYAKHRAGKKAGFDKHMGAVVNAYDPPHEELPTSRSIVTDGQQRAL